MTPAYRITINGVDVTQKWDKCLVSLTVTDQEGVKADALEVEFDDRVRIDTPPKGTPIEAWLGYEPTPIKRSAFKVDQWTRRGGSGGRRLHLSARAADLNTSIRASRMGSYHGQTVGQIVSTVAARNGLSTVVDPEIASREVDHIDQQHESDVHFLTRLAHRNGATFKLANGLIVIAKKGSTKLPSGRAKPTLLLTPDMVTDWTATSANRGDYAAASAHYGDHKGGRRGQVISGSGSPRHRLRTLFATKNEARRASYAALHDLKRGNADFETEGPGLPTFFSGALVQAKGFDQDVDGVYVLKTATHVYENQGYRTTLTMEVLGTPTDSESDTSDGDTEATP